MIVKCQTTASNEMTKAGDFNISYGTVHDSCLGSLLFIIFCNDLHRVLEHCNVLLFEDNTTLYFAH